MFLAMLWHKEILVNVTSNAKMPLQCLKYQLRNNQNNYTDTSKHGQLKL